MDELASIGVWVCDAHPIFLCGIVSALRAAGVTVVGSSALIPDSFDAPAVTALVYDAEAAGAVAAAARHRGPLALVGIVRDRRSERVLDVLASGGGGVLMRGELTPMSLVTCLRAVTHGQAALPADLVTRMLAAGHRGDGDLAGRELEVLRLLAAGRTTRTIAGELCYSERTIKNVVRDLMLKLDCSTRAQAVATATRQGLI